MEAEEISIFPERITQYASFEQRFFAALIDTFILTIPDWLITKYIGGTNFLREIMHGHFILSSSEGQFVALILGWLYYALQESGKTQATIGGRLMKIKVSDLNYNRISFAKATVRYLSEYISALALFIGYFMMFWNDKRQNLHDKIAGTLVLQKSQIAE